METRHLLCSVYILAIFYKFFVCVAVMFCPIWSICVPSTFCLDFVCAPSTLRLGSGDVLPEKFRLCSVYIQEVMFHKICLTMFCLRFHLRSIWVLFMFQRGPKSSQNAWCQWLQALVNYSQIVMPWQFCSLVMFYCRILSFSALSPQSRSRMKICFWHSRQLLVGFNPDMMHWTLAFDQLPSVSSSFPDRSSLFELLAWCGIDRGKVGERARQAVGSSASDHLLSPLFLTTRSSILCYYCCLDSWTL